MFLLFCTCDRDIFALVIPWAPRPDCFHGDGSADVPLTEEGKKREEEKMVKYLRDIYASSKTVHKMAEEKFGTFKTLPLDEATKDIIERGNLLCSAVCPRKPVSEKLLQPPSRLWDQFLKPTKERRKQDPWASGLPTIDSRGGVCLRLALEGQDSTCTPSKS